MSAMSSEITVNPTVNSTLGKRQKKHQTLRYRPFVKRIHQGPVMTYCQLDHREQTSVKFGTKYGEFYSWKIIQTFENVVCKIPPILFRASIH